MNFNCLAMLLYTCVLLKQTVNANIMREMDVMFHVQ